MNSRLYQTLLESTNAIPWKIDWITQEFTYIGPQIEDLLGWSQTSWKTTTDWVERIHPEDREYTVNYCVGLTNEGTDHEADYRALKKNGDFVWMRDVVHVIRERNATVAIVGFMFDISERKKGEEELNRLNRKLEKLSNQDELTGIANRRAFNKTLDTEWKRAQRNKTTLSALFLDIDFFKKYNDHYGHLQGDECLKIVSQVLKKLIKRPADFIARYGGEEFVILLPETNNETAVQLAEKCRIEILNQEIQHELSEVSGFVSVSIGISTVNPSENILPSAFIGDADRMLYKAKECGRNKIKF